jgi:hypothetical protein
MSSVTVTITLSNGVYQYSNNPSQSTYTSPSVTFQNHSGGGITVYHRWSNAAFTNSMNIANNSSGGPVSSATDLGNLECNAVAQGVANPLGWAHVIHVGS